MEKFNLETWLQDKSRKVVTAIGDVVKIIDANAPDKDNPIVGYIRHKQKWTGPWTWHIDGVYKFGGDDMDLFFADEKEELTELQETLEEACNFYVSLYNNGKTREELIEWIKGWCPRIIDLARKELQPEFDKEMDKMLAETDKVVYQKVLQDVLEPLPKWKKATEDKDFERHVLLLEDGRVVIASCVYKDEFYIELDDLLQIPK